MHCRIFSNFHSNIGSLHFLSSALPLPVIWCWACGSFSAVIYEVIRAMTLNINSKLKSVPKFCQFVTDSDHFLHQNLWRVLVNKMMISSTWSFKLHLANKQQPTSHINRLLSIMQVTHLASSDFYYQSVITSRGINKHTWEHLLNLKTTRIKWILTDYQIQPSSTFQRANN